MRRAAIRRRRISSQFFQRSLRPYPTPTLKEIIASPSKISLLIPTYISTTAAVKREPKNMVRKSQPNSGKQNLSVIQKAAPQAPAPTSNSEAVREAIMRDSRPIPSGKKITVTSWTSAFRGRFKIGCQACSSSSNAFASFRSACRETLVEPPVNRRQQFARLLRLALVAPEACEAHLVLPDFLRMHQRFPRLRSTQVRSPNFCLPKVSSVPRYRSRHAL